MNIGNAIREIRKLKNMTLEELSQKSGVALATLSRMENNRMTGTIESHKNICKALGVSLSDLYKEIEDDNKTVETIKKARRTEHFTHDDQSRYELLVARTTDKKITPLMLKLSEGASTQKEQNQTGVEKFVYLINGTVEASIGEQVFRLKRGDSLYFDASLPHSFKNIAKTEVEAVCVIAPSHVI